MNTFSALSFLCIVLVAIAGTLGAGGYLLFRMLDERFRQLEGTAAAAGAAGIGMAAKLVSALEALARPRPVAARIHQQNDGLIPVHNLQAVVGARTIPPGADGMVRLEPMRCPWFKAKAIRVLAHVDGMPSVEQRVTIGRCEVSQAPMFQWSGDGWAYAQRDGLTSLGIPSDVFAAPPGHAVGVDIAAFSDLTNRCPLEFSVRNENPHAVRVCIEAYGEMLQQPPPLAARKREES